MNVEQIAHICHEANRAYAFVTEEPEHTIYPPWRNAPEAIRESARVGVRAALAGATPRQLHESWMAGKLADGWTYDAVRDNSTKRHPCLVDYDQLPIVQRQKDTLFAAIVYACRDDVVGEEQEQQHG